MVEMPSSLWLDIIYALADVTFRAANGNRLSSCKKVVGNYPPENSPMDICPHKIYLPPMKRLYKLFRLGAMLDGLGS